MFSVFSHLTFLCLNSLTYRRFPRLRPWSTLLCGGALWERPFCPASTCHHHHHLYQLSPPVFVSVQGTTFFLTTRTRNLEVSGLHLGLRVPKAFWGCIAYVYRFKAIKFPKFQQLQLFSKINVQKMVCPEGSLSLNLFIFLPQP